MEPTEWNIRPASAGDEASISLIASTSFLETYASVLDGQAVVSHCAAEHSAGAYQRFLAEGYTAWLAEVAPGGAPAGYALLTPPGMPIAEGKPGDIELKRIYTLTQFHGSGMGDALMQNVISAARQHADRLLLGVLNANERALAFYKKNGFEKIDDRRHQVGDKFYHDYILAKAL